MPFDRLRLSGIDAAACGDGLRLFAEFILRNEGLRMTGEGA